MSVVERLEQLVSINPTTETPVLTGTSGATVLSRAETTALAARVLESMKNFTYERLTVQNKKAETRITYVNGMDYCTLAFANS